MADKSCVTLSATSPAPPSPDLFWNALKIVEQWRALRQEESAAFERACPGSYGQWSDVHAVPLNVYPLKVSPPTRGLLMARGRIEAERKRLHADWEKLRPALLEPAEGLYGESWSGEWLADETAVAIGRNELAFLWAFPFLGDANEGEAVSALLTALARRAETEAVEVHAADLTRQFKGKLVADIILGVAAAPAPMDSGKMIASEIGAIDNSALRTSIRKLKELSVIVKVAGCYSLSEIGRRIAARLYADDIPPQMS